MLSFWEKRNRIDKIPPLLRVTISGLFPFMLPRSLPFHFLASCPDRTPEPYRQETEERDAETQLKLAFNYSMKIGVAGVEAEAIR